MIAAHRLALSAVDEEPLAPEGGGVGGAWRGHVRAWCGPHQPPRRAAPRRATTALLPRSFLPFDPNSGSPLGHPRCHVPLLLLRRRRRAGRAPPHLRRQHSIGPEVAPRPAALRQAAVHEHAPTLAAHRIDATAAAAAAAATRRRADRMDVAGLTMTITMTTIPVRREEGTTARRAAGGGSAYTPAYSSAEGDERRCLWLERGRGRGIRAGVGASLAKPIPR